MKTALLFVALLIQIHLVASYAQPTEISVTLKPGYNLVANPLTASDNSIQNLFRNMQGGVPPGTKVFRFINTNNTFITITWDDIDNQFIPPSAAAETTLPGDGVFVFIPGTEDKILTFVGEVLPVTSCQTFPAGWSIKSALVPGGPILPITPEGGSKIFRYNRITKAYETWTFDDIDAKWIPDPGLPIFPSGEAIFHARFSRRTWCPGQFPGPPPL